MHWAKDCKSKFDIEGKPIPRNSKQGTPPGLLQQKPGANSIISFKPSTSGNAGVNIPALNDFFLCPQAVPSRVPTGLFGPPPPQTFSLLFGQSSLASKGFTVHPGITDLNYKEEIQIVMSSQVLWQFKKRDKIAQLLLLPYISINSSNNVRTDGFGSTDQKQSLWTSLVSEYAQPNINIKINNKRFSGLLNTGSSITIISKHLWPKSWAIQKVSCKLQEFLKSKYKKFIKIFKSTHMKDQKANLQH